MNTWKKETTTTHDCCLGVLYLGGSGVMVRYERATPADIIAAIKADEGLREAVSKYLVGVMDVRIDWRLTAEENIKRATAAESDRDAWRARAEKAEAERNELFARANGYSLDLDSAAKERDTAIAQRREAEKERDEAMEGLDDALRRIGIAKSERDSNMVAVSKQRNAIARLEKELAEAKAELIGYRGADLKDQVWTAAENALNEADALELRARRALDEWMRDGRSRSVGVTASLVRPQSLVFAKEDHGDPRMLVTAPTHVELARKLGLIP